MNSSKEEKAERNREKDKDNPAVTDQLILASDSEYVVRRIISAGEAHNQPIEFCCTK